MGKGDWDITAVLKTWLEFSDLAEKPVFLRFSLDGFSRKILKCMFNKTDIAICSLRMLKQCVDLVTETTKKAIVLRCRKAKLTIDLHS